MISIGDALEEIIQKYPFIEEGLSKGIINLSAYTREIKPQIEKRLFKSIKEGAMIMALKRISEKQKKQLKQKPQINLTNLTVRSNLTEFTFLNSESLVDKQRDLFNKLAGQKDTFCAVSQGIRETTFIASPEAALLIKRIFVKENQVSRINRGTVLLCKIDNLSSISIQLPEEVVYTPGVYYQILKMLAWEDINLIEILSTPSELTLIVENKDIDKTFSILKNLKL